MLIKEYRIPLPLTVDEYRIAQLYMIAKKSREESCGEGSGVEILVNEPYYEGPGGNGQYTHKIFHVGSHLPGWLKSLLPKSALVVEEMAWNAYPYTRTRYTCPFIDKFSLDIETVYKTDPGEIENVFNLKKSELNERAVDLIDVVKDQLVTAADYIREEDPCIYVSRLTGRGPLGENWLQEYWKECKGKDLPLENGKALMCAYKLCRVEFKYWGMQAKIERFIHDIALRKTMLRAHRQAVTWQDEWVNLTMEDVREIERQTQAALAKKMGGAVDDVPDAADQQTSTDEKKDEPEEKSSADVVLAPVSSPVTAWPISCSSESSSEDEEFFDCQDAEVAGGMLPVRWSSMELVPQGEESDDMEQDKSLQTDNRFEEKDSIFSAGYLQRYAANSNQRSSRKLVSTTLLRPAGRTRSTSPRQSAKPVQQPVNALILVFHGGTVLDTLIDSTTKVADLSCFRNSLEAVSRQHFASLSAGRLAIRLVSVPSLCPDAIAVLDSLSPFEQEDQAADDRPATETGRSSGGNLAAATGVSSSWPPLGCLPLFAASSPDYVDVVNRSVLAANQAYAEFIKSPEGAGFCGTVSVVADAVGSIPLYDALCREQDGQSRCGSENSIAEDPEEAASNDNSSNSNSSGNKDHFNPSASFRTTTGRTLNHLQAPPLRRLSCSPSTETSGNNHKSSAKLFLDFQVGDVFLLGSPLALVLTNRRWSQSHPEGRSTRPHCQGIYNCFHLMDPLAARLEPLLSARFANTRPVTVPRYHRYPLGDGKSTNLSDFVLNNPQLFTDSTTPPQTTSGRRPSDSSGAFFHGSTNSLGSEHLAAHMSSLSQRWWGSKRLDYVFYCPEGLTSFPPSALPHLLHASFWESADVAAFILRHMMRMDAGGSAYSDDLGASMGDKGDLCHQSGLPFSPTKPCEKWARKRTSVKIKNIGANHRANDVIVNETMPQAIVARFMYGPLDMVALTGEKVDVHLLRDATTGEWELIGSEVTDKTGRLVCPLPKDCTLPPGLHPIKMVVRGDHTYADLYMAVLPLKTQAVVFSIDGSFTASVSVTGRDPKVRAGAVDVVRHWQELGYLIIYITGRPDMQQRRVVSWLAQHNFPHGLLSFADGLSTDPLRHKAEYLKMLVNEVNLEICAAYGSSKDISVYSNVGLKPESIFIVGKISRKQQGQAQSLIEGYASHLANLAVHQCRPAKMNPYLLVPRGCLLLPGHGAPLLRRRNPTYN